MLGHWRTGKKMTLPLAKAQVCWVSSFLGKGWSPSSCPTCFKQAWHSHLGRTLWLQEWLYHQLLIRVQAKLHKLISDGDGPEVTDISAISVVAFSAYWHVCVISVQTTPLPGNGWSPQLQDTHSALEVQNMLVVSKPDAHTQIKPHA